jgi:hypothetical protein
VIFAAKTEIAIQNMTLSQTQMFGFPLEQVLIQCSFNGLSCSVNDLVKMYDSNLGNCFVFNSGYDSTLQNKVPLQKSKLGKADYGLRLTLNFDYIPKLAVINQHKGARVTIANNTLLNPNSTFLDLYDEKLTIPAGFETNIALMRVFNYHIPKPYTNCEIDNVSPGYFSSDLYNKIYHSPFQVIF